MEAEMIQEINEYVIDLLHWHTENNDAASCIAVMEEFGEWLDFNDEAPNPSIMTMPVL